jgi:hypothetical protein
LTFSAIFFAGLFGLTLSLSLVAFNIENQLFNPEVYKTAIIDQRVCERLPIILSQQFLSNALDDGNENIGDLFLSVIGSDNLQNFIKTIFPCKAIETTVFIGIDQLFEYINGKTTQEGFSLSLFKESSRENSKLAVEEYFKSLPDCTPAQLIQMGTTALLGQENGNTLFSCNPPDVLREVVTLPLMIIVESALQGIPDQVSIVSRFESLLNFLRTARTVMEWSPLLPLIFLGLTTLIAVRTWRSLMRWWGYPMLAAGLVTLAISLAISPIVYSLLTMLVFPNLPVNIVQEAVDLIAGTLAGVSQGLTQPIQLQSTILSFIGIGMVLGEKFSRPK